MGCAGYAPFLRSESQDAVLDAVIDRSESGTVAVFDLDGCLYDNRWRQAQIINEYAGRRGVPALHGVRVHHFHDWDLGRTLRSAGLDDETVEALREDLRAFWWERFFHGAYVGFDHAMPGAVRLVRAVRQAGAAVVYLTGRDASMHAGTVAALARDGFPAPGEEATLLTKPAAAMVDEDWKAQAMRIIDDAGTPAVFLDNEPTNVNLFHSLHPGALTVFVSTDHSPRPTLPAAEVPTIRGFLRTTDPVLEELRARPEG